MIKKLLLVLTLSFFAHDLHHKLEGMESSENSRGCCKCLSRCLKRLTLATSKRNSISSETTSHPMELSNNDEKQKVKAIVKLKLEDIGDCCMLLVLSFLDEYRPFKSNPKISHINTMCKWLSRLALLKITRLCLADKRKDISDIEFEKIVNHRKYPKLNSLDLSNWNNIPKLNEKVLESLTYLCLFSADITDETLARISRVCRVLKTLAIRGCDNLSVFDIASKKIQTIMLSQAKITDEALEKICINCPALEMLYFISCITLNNPAFIAKLESTYPQVKFCFV